MRIKSRKLYVWLISVGVILVIYLLYNLISETPSIEIGTEAKLTDTTAESDVSESDDEIGMIGEVGVGTIRKARYTHLDAEKRVDREFGFEKLLHREGDEWEIEKPYMNVFRHNFRCYMTAEKGKVRVEDAVGRATPKDATLTGNVVMHILPEPGSNVQESFIYLDDVVFLSEESQFSTDGLVKFTSRNAQMLGRGLKIVYNDELDRLKFLEIAELDALRIKQPAGAPLFSSEQRDVGGSGSDEQDESLDEFVTAEGPPQAGGRVVEDEKGEYYRCVFRGNVVIDCPEQLIFADAVSINNIFWSKGPRREDESKDTGDTGKTKTDVGVAEESTALPDESSGQFVDITVTCDNGIIVVPMDSSGVFEETYEGKEKDLEDFDDEKGRSRFIARRIDHCLVSKNTVASGPSELTFYANDVVTGTEDREIAVPVKITASRRAKFLPASNRIIFEGDVFCTMLRADSGIQKKYILSGPRLTVNLFKDEQSTASAADIEHLTADGGGVRLATVRTAGPKLVGGVELKCIKFDYDTGEQLFLATGPGGVIKVDNSNISEPKTKPDRKFSLQKRCYAVVRNFDTLKYYLETNQIVADAGRESVFIDYFPIVKGKHRRQVAATANHIEAFLDETADGRNELTTLSATGGITYEEEGRKNIWGKRKNIQFVGNEMFYDAYKSIIIARGDEERPCLFSGALVDGIEYDLKTGKVKTRIAAPGMLPGGR